MATRGRSDPINEWIGNHRRPEGGGAAQTLVAVAGRDGSDGTGALSPRGRAADMNLTVNAAQRIWSVFKKKKKCAFWIYY